MSESTKSSTKQPSKKDWSAVADKKTAEKTEHAHQPKITDHDELVPEVSDEEADTFADDLVDEMFGAAEVDAEAADAETAAPVDMAGLKDTLKKQEDKVKEYWDKVLRAKAELQNVRDRADKDVQKAHKFALERFVNALLPVVDSMERSLEGYAADAERNASTSETAPSAALEAASETSSDGSPETTVLAMQEGIDLTHTLLLQTLEKHGVKQLNPVGEVFNPDFHQAMKVEAVKGKSGTVLSVMQRGYVLNDRLIRPALVIVIK